MDARADLNLCWAHRSLCWFCHAAAHIGLIRNHCCPRRFGCRKWYWFNVLNLAVSSLNAGFITWFLAFSIPWATSENCRRDLFLFGFNLQFLVRFGILTSTEGSVMWCTCKVLCLHTPAGLIWEKSLPSPDFKLKLFNWKRPLYLKVFAWIMLWQLQIIFSWCAWTLG